MHFATSAILALVVGLGFPLGAPRGVTVAFDPPSPEAPAPAPQPAPQPVPQPVPQPAPIVPASSPADENPAKGNGATDGAAIPVKEPLPTETGATDTGSMDASPKESGPTEPPASLTPPVEARKRAYIVVDRVSTAAGTIESDNEELIVLRDERGRLKTFTKSRVIGVTYLLEGPSGRRVRILFNDGRTLVGKLVEDGYENVSIEIEGISTKYPRAAVSEVQP